MSHPHLSVLILAAGRGTRMYSDLPKVLHEIGGKPMLSHVIDTALSLQPTTVGVVIGHGKDAVRARISQTVQWIEQDQQLGTGHAVQIAMPHLPANGHTLVLYGDVPLIDRTTLETLLAAAGDGVALLSDVLDHPTGYGRIVREQGEIVGIVEEKDANAAEKAIREINTGVMVLPNAHLPAWLGKLQNANAQGEYYLTDVIALAVADGVTVSGITVRAHHLAAGVNNKLQLFELERIFQKEQAEKLLGAGITLRDANRFDLRGSLQHGRDVVIDVNTVFEGDCVLGNGVEIEAHCVLKNVTIGDGTRIKAFSHLENCTVGARATIGPFARLRPDAALADEVHVGNFVEIKKSIVGHGSKVNHLTYIGDTDIGQNSNIGAGTITCNYDGVNKFRTEIGDDVRIGSGTMLVAPVTVGDRATTGAGSVITKECPPDKLTLSRAQQVTVRNWKRPEKNKA
ncbi:MAG: bifunctional UDP-N-acetylglucosamine diphosphorylase/glucosamine-1-phosphate N-acetyltransferase GlmU [Neisseria sp.]|nr:bifunctional UDP-N-acetylglucosamine diphosphorylase/glucosamine-1-phosphate N-acetyltransferase GlmU [Neisseria sp.]